MRLQKCMIKLSTKFFNYFACCTISGKYQIYPNLGIERILHFIA